MASSTAKAKVLPCTSDSASCIQQFVTAFGGKAFRRPLTTTEVTRFTNFYTNRATLTQTGTFNEAVQLIVKAFLLSPSFLVPCLWHEGVKVWDTLAIAEYLAEIAPKAPLLPEDRPRDRARRRLRCARPAAGRRKRRAHRNPSPARHRGN